MARNEREYGLRRFIILGATFAIFGHTACSDGTSNTSAPEDGEPTLGDGQVEITEPTPVLNGDGTLNAWGWARRAIMEYERDHVRDDLRHRLKEWDFYSFVTPEYTISVTVADIYFASFASVEVVDHQLDEPLMNISLELRGEDEYFLPETPYASTYWDGDGGTVSIEWDQEERRIEFDFDASSLGPAAVGSVVLGHGPDDESLAAAVPFAEPGSFFYENKVFGMPITGEILVGEQSYSFDADDAYGVLDWGRGVWPEAFDWGWAVAFGTSDGRQIGLNLGWGEGDEEQATPNAMLVDGRLHKLGMMEWSWAANDEETWRFRDEEGRYDLKLVPVYYQLGELDLGLYSTHLDKVYGHFSGHITIADGTVIDLEDLFGFAEVANQQW